MQSELVLRMSRRSALSRGRLALAAGPALAMVACACPEPRITAAPAAATTSTPPPASSTAPTRATAAPVTPKDQEDNGVSFEQELDFLRTHSQVIVLVAPNGGRVAVSPTYQGRVMTSAVAPETMSLGWVNHAFIEAGKVGTAFDNYGGEDRFWLGPEGGQFGLYFVPGAPFDLDHWQTPSPLQQGAWPVAEQSPTSVLFRIPMTLRNYSGTEFVLEAERRIALLDADAVTRIIGAPIPDDVRWIAFETQNSITNKGTAAWTEAKGLLSIWILGQYAPSSDARALLPFDAKGKGPIVNDTYFGTVPSERLRVDTDSSFLSFRCDGQYRSKIGLSPERAKPIVGAYSEQSRLLTVVQYDKPRGRHPYVNSMWEHQAQPYAGDVVNSYNDGPPAPGKPSLGGFYELETSSPAARLAPGASLRHTHRTLHFVGEPAALAKMAQSALGVPVQAH
ncbi:MAG: hypothetical protein JW940_06570 [Polyangiaceae bacterium]|nr:hypothetical protein [Polyangiaceae bacterium]